MNRSPLETFAEKIHQMEILSKYDPSFLEQQIEDFDRLRKEPIKIGIAGAQGVGKTTLMKAIVASESLMDPPFPAREREETGVPIEAIRSGNRYMVEIYGKRRKKKITGKITENAIHIRTSAMLDSRHHKYLRLKGLKVYMPEFDIPEGITIVDLPGVGGNLAGVSKWAEKYILQDSIDLIFVLSAAVAITCLEAEANLIRMFGPQCRNALFIQNVYSNFDDDVDAVEKSNREFLDDNLKEYSYFKIDLKKALEVEPADCNNVIAPIKDRIRRVSSSRDVTLSAISAKKLATRLHDIRLELCTELDSITGEEEEYKRRKKEAEDFRRNVKATKEKTIASLDRSLENGRTTIQKSVQACSNDLIARFSEYVEGADSLKKKLLNRKLAREIGRMNKEVGKSVSEALENAQQAVNQVLNDSELVGDEYLSFTPLDIETSTLGVVSRKVLTSGGALGGSIAGFSLAGPIGALIGGIIGALLGKFFGGLLTSKSKKKRKVIASVKEQIEEQRPKMIKRVVDAFEKTIGDLRQGVDESFELRLREVIIPESPIASSKAKALRKDLAKIEAELNSLSKYQLGGTLDD